MLSPTRSVRKGDELRLNEYIEDARRFDKPWGCIKNPVWRNFGPRWAVFFEDQAQADSYKAGPEVGKKEN